ncbi:MAG: hypothetical protein AAF412_07285, partial [Pseudomonadota bacterium]
TDNDLQLMRTMEDAGTAILLADKYKLSGAEEPDFGEALELSQEEIDAFTKDPELKTQSETMDSLIAEATQLLGTETQ